MAERVVGALAELGTVHALVFFGHDGLDELTTTASSTVLELRDGSISSRELDPTSLGLAVADRAGLAGGDAAGNAQVVHRVLAGQHGPARDIAALNAAAALVVAGIADDLAGGLERAFAAIDDGHAAAALDALVRTSVAAREDGA
jgi:anthranilate phosphoribosyltransferase